MGVEETMKKKKFGNLKIQLPSGKKKILKLFKKIDWLATRKF